MTKCCKTQPAIRTYALATGVAQAVRIPAGTVEYTLRARTATVALLLAIVAAAGEQFSVRPDEVVVEERLALDADLDLIVTADAATVLEVWLWAG